MVDDQRQTAQTRHRGFDDAVIRRLAPNQDLVRRRDTATPWQQHGDRCFRRRSPVGSQDDELARSGRRLLLSLAAGNAGQMENGKAGENENSIA